MGGTTFLVGLVVDGEPVSTSSTILNQYQITVPMVDVHTIGAGGGAIAWVDAGGNLHVGPRSAGARPGPGLLRRGRYRADGHRRRPRAGHRQPGQLPRRAARSSTVELARDAVQAPIGDPLGMSVDEAAAAIYAIQNAQTADLVRKVVVDVRARPARLQPVRVRRGRSHALRQLRRRPRRPARSSFRSGSTAAVFSAYGLAASDIVLTAELSAARANFPSDAGRRSTAHFGQLEDGAATSDSPTQRCGSRRSSYEREADAPLHDAARRGGHPGTRRRRSTRPHVGGWRTTSSSATKRCTARAPASRTPACSSSPTGSAAVGKLPIRPQLPRHAATRTASHGRAASRDGVPRRSAPAGRTPPSTTTAPSAGATRSRVRPSSRPPPPPSPCRRAPAADVDRLGNLVIR